MEQQPLFLLLKRAREFDLEIKIRQMGQLFH